MRRVLVLAIVLGTLAFHPTTHAQHFPTSAGPFIRLEKARFALTEEVFFWEGEVAEVEPRGHLAATCHLTTTRPDGTEKVETIDTTAGDGFQDASSRAGGRRLGPEPLQLGRYVLMLECGGKKTPPASLTVEDVPILKDIDEAFEVSSPLMLGSPNAAVTLVVRNRSNQTIRFPHRGEMFESVAVALTKTTGEKWVSGLLVPYPVLLTAGGVVRSNIAESIFTWALADRVPTVVLPPGGTYRLNLRLADILTGLDGRTVPVGEYDVRFSTVMQMLIGERDGPWTEFSPVRLAVNTVAHGNQP